jgi:hypothetical protein
MPWQQTRNIRKIRNRKLQPFEKLQLDSLVIGNPQKNMADSNQGEQAQILQKSNGFGIPNVKL